MVELPEKILTISHNGYWNLITSMVKPLWLLLPEDSILILQLGKKQVRMAYVLKEEDLRKSVEILRNALQVYKD